MSGVNVGTAYLEVIPSAKGFAAKLQGEVGSTLGRAGQTGGQRASRGFGSTFGASMKSLFAATAGLAIGSGLVSFFKDANAEARESQKVGALTAQVIKSTGGAAKVTARDVGNLASAISRKTGIDDEAIQSASNLLLTFTNVRNEVGRGNKIFNQATKLATDMGAALGGDPKSSAIQLGKALNDPVKGITALTRVGVSFTEQQKEQIKSLVESGDTLGAQKVILGELKKEFGGAAAAMATPGEKAAVAWGNLKEQIGTAFLPVMDKLAGLFTSKIAPALGDFVDWLTKGGAASSVFGGVLSTVGAVVSAVGGWIKGDLVPFIKEVAAGYSSAMGGASGFSDALADAKPFIDVVKAALGALWSGLKIAYREYIPYAVQNFKNLMKILGMVGSAAKWLWNNAFAPALRYMIRATVAALRVWANFLRALAKVPGFGWAKKAADALDRAAGKALKLANAIKQIKDKTVTLTVQQKIVAAQGAKNRAELAGIRPRAKGGPASSGHTYLVGENGPEIFTTRRSGTIIPTHRIAAHARAVEGSADDRPRVYRLIGLGSDYIDMVADDTYDARAAHSRSLTGARR